MGACTMKGDFGSVWIALAYCLGVLGILAGLVAWCVSVWR